MTDRVAWTLALIILIAILLDYTLNNADILFFLARKALEFLEYVTFWR